MKTHCRRFFLKSLAALPLLGASTACSDHKKTNEIPSAQILEKNTESMELSKKMDKKQLNTMLDQRVALVMEQSHNCAQSTFYSLSEQFGLGGDDILKALTPLPGVAERGETCGAITGALMVMGLVFGRDNLEDWETYRSSLEPTNEFVGKFEKELGSTLCCNIQEHAFGKSYKLIDPEELKAFQLAGATAKCTKVVQKAVKLAAGIILEYENRYS